MQCVLTLTTVLHYRADCDLCMQVILYAIEVTAHQKSMLTKLNNVINRATELSILKPVKGLIKILFLVSDIS